MKSNEQLCLLLKENFLVHLQEKPRVSFEKPCSDKKITLLKPKSCEKNIGNLLRHRYRSSIANYAKIEQSLCSGDAIHKMMLNFYCTIFVIYLNK